MKTAERPGSYRRSPWKSGLLHVADIYLKVPGLLCLPLPLTAWAEALLWLQVKEILWKFLPGKEGLALAFQRISTGSWAGMRSTMQLCFCIEAEVAVPSPDQSPEHLRATSTSCHAVCLLSLPVFMPFSAENSFPLLLTSSLSNFVVSQVKHFLSLLWEAVSGIYKFGLL